MISQCVKVNVLSKNSSMETQWLPIVELSTSGKWAIVESLMFAGEYHFIEVSTSMALRQDRQTIWDLEAAKAKLLELDS